MSHPEFSGRCYQAFGFLVGEFGFAIEEAGRRLPGDHLVVSYGRGEVTVRVALDLRAAVVDVEVNGRNLRELVDDEAARDLAAARGEDWASEVLVAAAALRRECPQLLDAA